jgi:hypothetical protein
MKKDKNKEGFLVFLKIIDKKTGQALVKLDKAMMGDLEKLEEELIFLIKKFK